MLLVEVQTIDICIHFILERRTWSEKVGVTGIRRPFLIESLQIVFTDRWGSGLLCNHFL